VADRPRNYSIIQECDAESFCSPEEALRAIFYQATFQTGLQCVTLGSTSRIEEQQADDFSLRISPQALIYLHLQEYESGREFLQVLEEDEFAREYIAPPDGVGRAPFLKQ